MDVLTITQLAGVLSMLLPLVREVLQILVLILPETFMEFLRLQFIYLPLALFALYPLAIQYERGGWWRCLFLLYATAGLLSAYLNYTTFVVYLKDVPKKRENTFSQRCERLVRDPGWRGVIARLVARYTNYSDPKPPHIPLPGTADA